MTKGLWVTSIFRMILLAPDLDSLDHWNFQPTEALMPKAKAEFDR